MFFSVAFLASIVATVSAHATFQEMWVNGVDQGNYCARLPQSNSPVTDVTSTAIAFNANASPSANLCEVNPGDTITIEMHQQPGDRSCANEAIGGAHYGPMIMYMAKVDDATTAVGSDAGWFKIDEMGLDSNNPDLLGQPSSQCAHVILLRKFLALTITKDNCGHWTFTVPSVTPGNYLLRAETIALHTAASSGGAQFYMSCFQLNVGGSESVAPDTVKFPGAYSADDPGILINIYQDLTAYTVPGPSPFGTTSPLPAGTAFPTTATWDTALQPTTVPTAPVATAINAR